MPPISNAYDYLVREDGDYVVQEDGSYLITADNTLISTITTAFQAHQAQRVRQIDGKLVIISHARQIGSFQSYAKELGGAGHYKLAQAFIPPRSMDLLAIEFMVKGNESNTAYITGRIEGNSGGNLPDGVSAGSFYLFPPTNEDWRWKRITFTAAIALTAGTTYWIILENSPTTSDENFWVAADDLGSELHSARYISSWIEDATKCLMIRLVSDVESENEHVIPDMTTMKIVRDRDIPAYSFVASLANKDNQYSAGQIYSSFMEAGKKIKAYIGMNLNPVTYYLAFVGLTEDCPAGQGFCEIKGECYMSKLLTDKMTTSALGGLSYEAALQDVAEHSGITDFSLRVTGKTVKANTIFQNMLASSVAEKIREATVDRLQFKNTTTMYTTARAKATISTSATPDYEINEDSFIRDIKVNTNNDVMINRITVTNDENGENSSDGEVLDIGAYQTIGSGSATLGSSTESSTVNFTFSQYSCIYIGWDNTGTNSMATELTRYCGGTGTYGSMSFDITNRNYPAGTASYVLTIKGCPVSNAGTNTVLVEAYDQESAGNFGVYNERIDNRIFAGTTDALEFANAVLDERANPRQIIQANCRGIVDIYPDDIISFKDTRANLDNLAIATLVELNYKNDPPEFSMYIEAEKMPYESVANNFLLQEIGGTAGHVTQESGTASDNWIHL